jgi:hypothetical protein
VAKAKYKKNYKEYILKKEKLDLVNRKIDVIEKILADEEKKLEKLIKL